MTKKWCFVLITAMLFLSPIRAFADAISELKKEVEGLKTKIELLEAQDEETSSQLSDLVDISGYADGEFKLTDHETADTRSEFRIHHLSLFFIKQISEKWRMFSEVEYEDAPNLEGNGTNMTATEGKVFVEVFTIEYSHNPYANFRLGRFLNPGGIWNVEHYPPFVLTQEKPKLVGKIFPKLNEGLEFFGSHHQWNVTTDYILYVSNGSGDNTAHGDVNSDKAWGADLGFKLPFLTRTEIGFSYDRENKDENNDEVRILGVDARLHWNDLQLQSEYAKKYTDQLSGSTDQTIGWYSQLTYDWRKWTVGYRYDWYDPNHRNDENRTITNTVALNYHFTPKVVGKIEHHFIKDESSSDVRYTKTLFSVAVYLGH